MKTNLLRALAILLVSTLSLPLLAAPLGTAFTYQGRLNNGANPAGGIYDLRFRVWDSELNGTPASTTLTYTVPITNGLFTVILDFGSGVFTGQSRWLEMSVSTNGAGVFTTLLPRQPMTATPYALNAANVSGSIPAVQISGTLSPAQLPATVVTNNSGNLSLSGAFTGNGAGLSNVNAAALGGLGATNFWQLGGNNVRPGQFLGSTNYEAVELKVNNACGWRLEPASNGMANVVGGYSNNSVASGVAGATIAGGGDVGGWHNVISSGANHSTIGGGRANSAGGSESTVAGGTQNKAWGQMTAIGGGFGNQANGLAGTIGGGYQNTIQSNSLYGTIPGGYQNSATNYALAAGNRAKANHSGAFVWADSQPADFASTASDQFIVRATNGVGINTNNPQAALHVAGTIKADNISGAGTGLTALNGGALLDASISSNKLAPGAVNHLDAPDGTPLNAVQVDTNGWVGMGTTAPVAGLDLRNGPQELAPYVYKLLPGGAESFKSMIDPISVAYSSNKAVLAIGSSMTSPGGVTLVGVSYGGHYFAGSIIPGQNSFNNMMDLTYGPPAAITGLAFSGTNLLAIAAPGADSVTLANITNLNAPLWQSSLVDGVGGWNDLAKPQAVAFSGNVLAIASQGDKAVTLASVSNPAAPVLASVIKSGVNGFTNIGEVMDVAFSGNLLAIASYSSNAVILADVSNPSAPALRAVLNAASGFTNLMGPRALAFDGSLLAVAAMDSYSVGLVNISNPFSPQLISLVNGGFGGLPGTYFMSAPKDLAFVWSGTNRFLVVVSSYEKPLTIINVTDPAKPIASYTSYNAPVLGSYQPISVAAGPSGTFAAPLSSYASDFDGLVALLDFRPNERNLVTEGRVGIGTSSPEATLDVAGDMRVNNAGFVSLNANHISLGWAEANGDNSVAMTGGEANGSGSFAAAGATANDIRAFAFGYGSEASGYQSTAIGSETLASGDSSVALGSHTRARGAASLAAGYESEARGWCSTALGYGSYAATNFAAALGFYAQAIGEASFAAGYAAQATNNYAISLGRETTAGGVSSFAAGYKARALHDGSFVWADSVPADFASTAPNQFLIRAAGGVGIGGAPQDAALDIEGATHINDHDFYLRGSADRNHGLGWYGPSKQFANVSLDGPVLYGYYGGGLGSTSGSNRLALSWDLNGSVFIDPGSSNNGGMEPGLRFGGGSGEGISSRRTPGAGQYSLSFYAGFGERMTILSNGCVGISITNPTHTLTINSPTTNSVIKLSGAGAFGSGATLNFGDANYVYLSEDVDDSLTIYSSGRKAIMGGYVGIGKTAPATALDVNGTVTATGFAGAFSGSGAGLSAVNADTLDNQHGAYYLNAGNLSAGTLADTRLSANVALLNNSQTFTGAKTFSDNVRVGDKQIFLRGGSDTLHGMGWFASGTFAGSNPDGPVLYGCGGGALGATCSGQVIALAWNNAGNVGIGTTAPDAKLTVNGTASKPGGGSWTTYSDRRLKDVGEDFTHGLAELETLQPVHYRYKTDNSLGLPSQPDHIGVVAQQVQQAIPEAVEQNKDGYLVVNNDPVIWTMVNAIKELNQKVESKNAENAELKRTVNELKELVGKLIRKLDGGAK